MKVKVSYSTTLSEFNELDLALATTPGKEFIIGRSPDSDLVLDSADVSRVHGKFFVQGGKYYFCDLNSRNGSIINGRLAEKNIPYLLRDTDVLCIGDYVLTMEEVLAAQLPETVFRVIDPALFSGRQVTENVNSSNVANQAPEVVKIPQEVSQKSVDLRTPIAEELSQTRGEVEAPEIVHAASPKVEEARTAPENIIQTAEAASAVPAKDEGKVGTPIEEEATFVQPNDLVSLVPSASAVPALKDEGKVGTPIEEEATFVQPRDLVSPPIAEEATFVQPRDLVSPPIAEEATFVQPRDLPSLAPEAVNAVPADVSDEVVNLKTSDAEAVEPLAETVIEVFSTVEVVEPVPEAVIEVSGTVEVIEIANKAPTDVSESEEGFIVEAQEAVSSKPSEVREVSDLTNIQSLETTAAELDARYTPATEELEVEIPEVTTSTPESVSETPEIISQIEEVSQAEEAQSTEVIVSAPHQMITQKNIVLIAHESKKSELGKFVAKHQEFLSQTLTITWPSISEVLHQQAGLTISEQIPAATSGGYQKIAALVGSGDILAVIFLRDFLQPQAGQANEEAMLRLCNINQVL